MGLNFVSVYSIITTDISQNSINTVKGWDSIIVTDISQDSIDTINQDTIGLGSIAVNYTGLDQKVDSVEASMVYVDKVSLIGLDVVAIEWLSQTNNYLISSTDNYLISSTDNHLISSTDNHLISSTEGSILKQQSVAAITTIPDTFSINEEEVFYLSFPNLYIFKSDSYIP